MIDFKFKGRQFEKDIILWGSDGTSRIPFPTGNSKR
jgi:hypothetical protein